VVIKKQDMKNETQEQKEYRLKVETYNKGIENELIKEYGNQGKSEHTKPTASLPSPGACGIPPVPSHCQ
jgi:hypothetical protein